MGEPTKYGQLQSEAMAEENRVCRQIVRNVSEFGVTERQRLMIIYLLALELEDTERMQVITQTVKDVGGDAFLVSRAVDGPTS